MASGRLRQPQAVEDALEFVRNKIMQFADVGNDLELVEKKLTAELSAVFGPDVFQLHGRCQDLKAQINKMIRDLAELYEARKELVNVIGNQLTLSASLKNFEKLIDPHARVDDDTHSMEMLGMHYQALWNGEEFEVEEAEEVETKRPLTPLTVIGNSSSLDVTPTKVETPTPETAFKPISQKQFDDIPALVKRRAKLEQINELYKHLFDMAVERKRCLPVKLKEISQAGIQVFGQTGKLENAQSAHTFRDFQIGLIEVSKTRRNQ
ncbi:hypothetical protein, conserved [Babesia ovata]|uniref:Spindle and kinetochore-associated protein 2 n=1 Tax=Babesia ovata TaxID=189622 RepID=A0A2H6K7H8_9APIC|nr:uncharacterized protein BOVATA_004440 [Babesia ovata]GBE58951.1 hypothetical protein, conserved [Babesia ovata]